MKKEKLSCDVFISCRRGDGETMALNVAYELKKRRYDVFFERVGSQDPACFDERRLAYIQSCKDFVLILSPHALDRCENEDDWVRRELEEAIKCGKNIVPIEMGGFNFPDEPPAVISKIRFLQALTPTMDYFEESIDRLCKGFLSSRPRRSWLKIEGILAAAIVIIVLALIGMGVLPHLPA